MNDVRFGALIPSIVVLAMACSQREPPKPTGLPFSFAEQIGWAHGPCLAVQNPGLSSGTIVALAITGEPQRIQQARIRERTTSGETCHALMEGRAAMNAKPGTSFYALDDGSVGSSEMGVGIIAPSANPQLVNGLVRIDLDHDGHSELFASCATSEGIKFTVWTDTAYKGEPRWSAYYYLDYDITPNCPPEALPVW